MIKFHSLKNVWGYDFFFEKLEAGALEMPAQLVDLVFMTEVGEKKISIQTEDSLHFL